MCFVGGPVEGNCFLGIFFGLLEFPLLSSIIDRDYLLRLYNIATSGNNTSFKFFLAFSHLFVNIILDNIILASNFSCSLLLSQLVV